MRADVDPARREHVEAVSVRIVGICFLVLALYIAYDSVRMFLLRESPERKSARYRSRYCFPRGHANSREGQAQSGADDRQQRACRGREQTELCMYLSAILLGGLVLNATFGWWWADPAAGVLMIQSSYGRA